MTAVGGGGGGGGPPGLGGYPGPETMTLTIKSARQPRSTQDPAGIISPGSFSGLPCARRTEYRLHNSAVCRHPKRKSVSGHLDKWCRFAPKDAARPML